MIVLAALIVAAAVLIAAYRVARAAQATPPPPIDPLAVLHLFAPGIAAVQQDPRALLVWQPLARAARQLHPGLFAMVDAAAGATFPFTSEQIEAAHAQWTAEWLAWERAHDAEFKRKSAALEHELGPDRSQVARARLDELEREKLDRYQRRYEEYVRVGKALQALPR